MLPYLTGGTKRHVRSLSAFKGLNGTNNRSEGELTQSVNMSAANYPAICVRDERHVAINVPHNINGAGVYDGLFHTGYDDGGSDCRIYHGDNTAVINTDCDTMAPRRFAAISDTILILPDKVIYNTSDNSVTKTESSQKFTQTDAHKKAEYQCNRTIDEIPYYVAELHNDGVYSASITKSTYTSYHFCPQGIKEGDIVHISMQVHPVNATQDKKYSEYKKRMKDGFFAKITSLHKESHEVYQGKVEDITRIYFDEGVIDMAGYEQVTVESITLSTKMPHLEHLCTHGNRVWGTEGNSVLCSALGKPDVWYDYSADKYGTLPSSSYSVNVDSDGEFTAICSYNGNVLAFKQNCIHKIHGTEPENFAVYTQFCNGVKKGAHNTLVAINGVLYYKGVDGFYAYNGGIPECISRNIRSEMTDVISCATDGTNYYALISGEAGKKLLVYYPQQRIWHSESIDDAMLLIGDSPHVYAVCKNSIIELNDKSSAKKCNWKFEMLFDENTYNHKQYTRTFIKYRLAKNSTFALRAVCDDNLHIAYNNGEHTEADCGYSIYTLPPVRCREMKLQFEGRGDFELYNITREYCLLNEKD